MQLFNNMEDQHDQMFVKVTFLIGNMVLFFTAIGFLILGYRLGTRRLEHQKSITPGPKLKNSLMDGLRVSEVDQDRKDYNTMEIKQLLLKKTVSVNHN